MIEVGGLGSKPSTVNNDPTPRQLGFGPVRGIHLLEKSHQLRVWGGVTRLLGLNRAARLVATTACQGAKCRDDNGDYRTHRV